jgi:hypothetical protein
MDKNGLSGVAGWLCGAEGESAKSPISPPASTLQA